MNQTDQRLYGDGSESLIDRMKREEIEESQVILQHEIGATSVATPITVIIKGERLAIEILQNGKTIVVDKWQALELAKELLNNRDYLKRAVCSNCRSPLGSMGGCTNAECDGTAAYGATSVEESIRD